MILLSTPRLTLQVGNWTSGNLCFCDYVISQLFDVEGATAIWLTAYDRAGRDRYSALLGPCPWADVGGEARELWWDTYDLLVSVLGLQRRFYVGCHVEIS